MLTSYGSFFFRNFSKMGTKIKLFPKICFLNSFLKLQPKRHFSETVKLNLDQRESYLWNEHDRMIVQLDNNVVPLTSLPKFMKELIEICNSLNRYIDYIKGWDYAAKFFHQNLKNFNNEDFSFYVIVLAYNNFNLESQNIWPEIETELLSRTLDKQTVINLMSNLVHCEFVSQDFWPTALRKVEAYNNLIYEDYITLANILDATGLTINDPIWETILSQVENSAVPNKINFPITYLPRAVLALQKNTKRDSSFYAVIINYLDQNINNVPSAFLGIFLELYQKIKKFNNSELATLILQTFPLAQKDKSYGKFVFYEFVFKSCVLNSGLRNTLESLKLPEGFVLPSASFIGEYGKYLNELEVSKPEAHEKIVENFWAIHSQNIGVRVSQAITYSLYGLFESNTISEAKEYMNLE
jgi:hypothetical protein